MWNSSMVEWLDIEVTSYCPLKCPGCLRQQLGHYIEPHLNKKKLDLDLLKQRINKEDLPNLKTINFCGSIDEPMTHPQIEEIAEWVTSNGWFLNINTSGSVRMPKFWSKFGSFLGSHSHSVLFGIDGLRDTSERYRIGSDWKLVRNNFRAFISSGGTAVWQFIVFEWNQHQMEDAKRISTEEGFSGFRVIWSHRDKSGEVRKRGDVLQQDTLSGLPTKSSESILRMDPLSCRYLQAKRLFLNHQGILLPCCHFHSDILKTIWGKWDHDTDLTLLWQSEGGEAVNIHNNSIPQILDGGFFSGITESWEDNPLTRCVNTCMSKNYDRLEDYK